MLDLSGTGDIEAGSDLLQPLDHGLRRIRFDRVKNPGCRQRFGKLAISRLDHVQVEDEERRRQFRVLLEEPADCR